MSCSGKSLELVQQAPNIKGPLSSGAVGLLTEQKPNGELISECYLLMHLNRVTGAFSKLSIWQECGLHEQLNSSHSSSAIHTPLL